MWRQARISFFYRGRKRTEWDYHPVFRDKVDKSGYDIPMILPEMKPIDVARNFAHPLNFLCILDVSLLRTLVANSRPDIQTLFGYNGESEMLDSNLSDLKLCFARFGVDKNWGFADKIGRNTYYAVEFRKNPTMGISFFYTSKGEFTAAKIRLLWNEADWHTLISSMMLQYKNVYSDISFMGFREDTEKMVQNVVENKNLRNKIMFATGQSIVEKGRNDFAVIDELERCVSPANFRRICFENPNRFLNTFS